jgi:hypothetical protein
VALSLCPLLSRQLIVCNPTPRNTPERLREPIFVLTLSLVEPMNGLACFPCRRRAARLLPSQGILGER